jgi:hypothetical protein
VWRIGSVEDDDSVRLGEWRITTVEGWEWGRLREGRIGRREDWEKRGLAGSVQLKLNSGKLDK